MAFQHNRVREHVGSGGSTYRVSAPLHEGMLSVSKRLLKKLCWTGVVMVEYRWNQKDDSFVLIEINGRFWGSLALPVALGVDFPFALYRLLVHANTETPKPAYPVGIFCRDLFPDIRILVSSPLQNRARNVCKECALGAMRILLGKERWDFLTWDDIRPAVIETSRVIQKVFSSLFARVRKKISPLFRDKGAEIQARNNLIDALHHAKHILFVCYGNINRSAFAAAYLRKKLVDGGIPDILTESSGVYPRENRPASFQATVTAGSHTISLHNHRSKVLSHNLSEWADVILYFDSENKRQISKLFPSVASKAYPLALIQQKSASLDIADPHGRDDAYFSHTFSRIKECIDEVYTFLP